MTSDAEFGSEELSENGRGLKSFLPFVASLVWLVGFAGSFVLGVSAKETCSSVVGSVQEIGTNRLVTSCDLVGWLMATSQLGGFLVIVLASLSGAWKSWPAALVALATIVTLQMLYIGGLVYTGLL